MSQYIVGCDLEDLAQDRDGDVISSSYPEDAAVEFYGGEEADENSLAADLENGTVSVYVMDCETREIFEVSLTVIPKYLFRVCAGRTKNTGRLGPKEYGEE